MALTPRYRKYVHSGRTCCRLILQFGDYDVYTCEGWEHFVCFESDTFNRNYKLFELEYTQEDADIAPINEIKHRLSTIFHEPLLNNDVAIQIYKLLTRLIRLQLRNAQ